MKDRYAAFVDKQLVREPLGSGKLDRLTYAVKDVMAIKGYTNTAGNPDWLRTHEAAEQNAAVIDLLLENGATLTGTTHTDELMYSLNGENYYYGTPVNPKAKDRIPGGSSSGSAVAVAAGLVDFSLGTDTGGSVRIPSSYCGIYGIRPTHNSVPMEGVIPLAPSFDTVGWMAKTPELLQAVGDVILEKTQMTEAADFTNVFLAEEARALLDNKMNELLTSFLEVIEQVVSKPKPVSISPQGLDVWADTFRILQGLEIGDTHGDWIKREKPRFGPGIDKRFAWASTLKKEDFPERFTLRKEIQENLASLLAEDGVLILPTAPGPAPLLQLSTEELEGRRKKTMQLACVAGLTGFPQISIPFGSMEGKPVGISILADRNQDRKLLALAVALQQNLSFSKSSLE